MKSWIVPAGSTAGAESLRLIDRPSPPLGRGQVRIRPKAWSTNYRDLSVALGRFGKGPMQRDTVPLSDGAGEVIEIGDGVSSWAVGDRVAATFFQNWAAGPIHSGAFGSDLGGWIDGLLAEEVVLPEHGLVRIPDRLSFEQAACLPCAALTAWNALFERGDLRPGQSVLVLGTGGVSMFALLFAKRAGASVILTSSSDDKLARGRSLGADQTINYRGREDWDAAVLELTGGRGVDIALEVGGPGTIQRSIEAVATGGMIAVIGLVAGGLVGEANLNAEINLRPLIRKSARIEGMYVGSRAMFENMNRAIAATDLDPPIDRRFAFEEAPEAYRYQQSGAHFGKVVISADMTS